MNCIVVVDSWKNCEHEDLEKFPWLEDETKLFGKYLDLQLKLIKEKFNVDIIFCPSHREIMDEIDIESGIVVNDLKLIKGKYEYYYFCGFHLGRCINKKVVELNELNTGIVLNLSQSFPADSYIEAYSKNIEIKKYFYSYNKGFEKCSTI